MKFELNKKEQESAKKYLEKTKAKYDSYGYITYSFTHTGIGVVVKIKSSHKNKFKDITDVNSW